MMHSFVFFVIFEGFINSLMEHYRSAFHFISRQTSKVPIPVPAVPTMEAPAPPVVSCSEKNTGLKHVCMFFFVFPSRPPQARSLRQ